MSKSKEPKDRMSAAPPPPPGPVLPPGNFPPSIDGEDPESLEEKIRGADVDLILELQEVVDLLVQETDYPQRLDYAEIVRVAAILLPERTRRLEKVLFSDRTNITGA